jgi:ribosomal protein S18 acetylase RimI-like enzyme
LFATEKLYKIWNNHLSRRDSNNLQHDKIQFRNSFMKISPFSPSYIPEAARLFVQSYRKQRLATPMLPSTMENQQHVEAMLADTFDASNGLAATQDGKLLGYLGWFLVDHFRDSERKGAYVPEWGHACIEEGKAQIYAALYRAAGEQWTAAGCQVHAITLLAHDQAAEKIWFWNGFGMVVVDAIRPMQPLDIPYDTRLTIRKATPADADALTQLDAEHWQHYSRSPIFMAPRIGKDVAENIAFLERPKNSVWLADAGSGLAGFMRYDGYDFENVAVLESEDGIVITGAYVRPAYRGQKVAVALAYTRPAYRGQKVAVALLDAALKDYAARGLKYCTLDFESSNPEAASFWMKYFDPVCLSLLRVPEWLPSTISPIR